jgi:hypothetical protein
VKKLWTHKRAVPTTSMLAMALLLLMPARASSQEESVSTDVRAADLAAGTFSVSNFRYHISPSNTQAGLTAAGLKALGTHITSAPVKTASATIPEVPPPGFYPSDLVFFGGKVVKSVESHNIYVNCNDVTSCWGNPQKFLSDLGQSNFIHVTDQYVGSAANGRYTTGTSLFASYAFFSGDNVISENAIFGIVHAAVVALGASTHNGYGHIYHVFLPKGVDTCFDFSNQCYSPDVPSSFVFCAYHASLDFKDIGHVLLSVEPYQNVPGCQAAPPNPNGMLADSTNPILAHELIESITDPDAPTGWVSFSSLDTAGFEIGDLCQPLGNKAFQFLYVILTLNGHKYSTQLMYSNKYHACAPGS